MKIGYSKKQLVFVLVLSIICVSVFNACLKQIEPQKLKNGFATKQGRYQKGFNFLTIREMTNGKLVFDYYGNDDHVLGPYQNYAELNLFRAFDQDKKWALYIDNKKSLWFYSEDIKQASVWLKLAGDSTYTEHNFCKEDIPIPNDFLDYLKMDKNEICATLK